MTPVGTEDAKSDQTRKRLIDAAGQVFAEVGFQAATVREICDRAGANVAAINYHFRDKLGLYREVFRTSLMAERKPEPQEGIPADPEAEITAFIGSHLRGLLRAERPVWWRQLMAREMAQPSPAMAEVVEAIIRPNERRLRLLVSLLIDADAESKEVRLCAHSIIAQCLHYVHARPVLAHLWPETEHLSGTEIEEIAAHITRFSLSAMHDLRKQRRQGLLVRKG